jgi:hypothetical protein
VLLKIFVLGPRKIAHILCSIKPNQGYGSVKTIKFTLSINGVRTPTPSGIRTMLTCSLQRNNVSIAAPPAVDITLRQFPNVLLSRPDRDYLISIAKESGELTHTCSSLCTNVSKNKAKPQQEKHSENVSSNLLINIFTQPTPFE